MRPVAFQWPVRVSAKSAFSTYLSGLRQELSKKNINVITVHPGFVKTQFGKITRKACCTFLFSKNCFSNLAFDSTKKLRKNNLLRSFARERRTTWKRSFSKFPSVFLGWFKSSPATATFLLHLHHHMLIYFCFTSRGFGKQGYQCQGNEVFNSVLHIWCEVNL